MNHLEEQLRRLVAEACANPPGSQLRQKRLTQVIRLTSKRLWRESSPYYQDALQQTWLYFCHNVCEATTADEPFNPERGSVITWLNVYLKRRLQDFYLNKQRELAKISTRIHLSRSPDSGDTIDAIDNLAATPDPPPILENVSLWAKTDSEGELRRTHIQGRPDVNCQVLILRRLPPEASWQTLSAQFNLSISTLSSFYQRHCIPRLRKFAEQEGYL
jgi:hypothetical protein